MSVMAVGGLVAGIVLITALTALELVRAGQPTVEPRPAVRFGGLLLRRRVVIGLWAVAAVLLLPRIGGLIT